MRLHYSLALGVAAATLTTGASAQHPMVLTKLQELNAQAPAPATTQIQEAIATTAKAFGEANNRCVPNQVVVGEIAPITGARGILQAVMSGQVRNAWTVYVTYQGCPEAGPFRYMVVQKNDGSLLAPLVNEGRTFANPSIMRDTSAQAALAAVQKGKSLDPSCTGEKMEMGATKIVAQSPDLGPELFGARYIGSWSEVWRFSTCGRAFDVPIEFTPDGDGGAYTNIKGDQIAVVP